jgi:hypothetical protein
MFGNRVGWGISAVILLVASFLLWRVHQLGTVMTKPGPVGRKAADYSMQLPIDPRSIASWMSEPGESQPLYRQSIQLYLDNPSSFDRYADGRSKDPADLAQVQKVLDLWTRAAKMRGRGVFSDKPGELITYDSDRPTLKALDTLKQCMLVLGANLRQQKKIDQAKPLYQALFSLGVKLYEERMIFEEWHVARNFLAVTRYLGEMSTLAEESRKMQEFDDSILPFYKANIEPLQKHIFVANPDPARFPQFRPWAGDMAAIAQYGGDHMWRVEALFALGRAKFAGATFADRTGAERLTGILANDPDPLIKLAATQARDLTVEEFRKIR